MRPLTVPSRKPWKTSPSPVPGAIGALMAVEALKFLAGIESRERERTGISSLKIKYNRVFGYFIEVTKANLKEAAKPDRVRVGFLQNRTVEASATCRWSFAGRPAS